MPNCNVHFTQTDCKNNSSFSFTETVFVGRTSSGSPPVLQEVSQVTFQLKVLHVVTERHVSGWMFVSCSTVQRLKPKVGDWIDFVMIQDRKSYFLLGLRQDALLKRVQTCVRHPQQGDTLMSRYDRRKILKGQCDFCDIL